jgi:DNA-binding response OmpR family regulator
MTASNDTAAQGTSTDVVTSSGGAPRLARVSVLLYSDDYTTRDAVRAAVGRRPAKDVEVVRWHECATADAVISSVEAERFDILVLDGEAAKVGGLGLARQLKNEIFECPPIIVLTGRPQDSWLAAWSQADLAVPHPLDPIALTAAVTTLARAVVPNA